ncbi:MAG: hypothetical protein VKL20_04125 [Synechocystis sp.]|nr:hypothetical protein [Synechocystis sp.]
MSNQPINLNVPNKTQDPDFLGAEVALKRAGQRAREQAKQAGIGVIILKNGQIVEETPNS